MAALIATLFAVYQSYKTYVSRNQQMQPQTMAMAAGR
jgi:Tfp pilus assembly protein PilE